MTSSLRPLNVVCLSYPIPSVTSNFDLFGHLGVATLGTAAPYVKEADAARVHNSLCTKWWPPKVTWNSGGCSELIEEAAAIPLRECHRFLHRRLQAEQGAGTQEMWGRQRRHRRSTDKGTVPHFAQLSGTPLPITEDGTSSADPKR